MNSQLTARWVCDSTGLHLTWIADSPDVTVDHQARRPAGSRGQRRRRGFAKPVAHTAAAGRAR